MGLVFLGTLFGVAAQYFIKVSFVGMKQITIPALATNYHLWAGLVLYGIFTGLLILALRDGELSLLYPVISLNYVWVTILSVVAFDEAMNFYKVGGIAVICLGVALLGKGRDE